MINTVKDLRCVLDNSIKKSSNVFIVGHNEPDFDAIGSAIGLQVYAKNIGKKAYIVVEDTDLEPGVKKIIEEKFNCTIIVAGICKFSFFKFYIF